ncbi:MAG: polysaccharide biosynthesis/export family protein [Halioglobus sp.]|nr:polysaccharide biosynthesis/export family protein [Halioglobus sp.]
MSYCKSQYPLIALFLAILSGSVFSAPYTVNPGDILRVDVWNEEDLSREILVRPDGVISLPMAGEIDTSNHSPSEVANEISKGLAKYMKDAPQVVVSLVDVPGNKIFVIGKVIQPGEYKITSDTDVMQALALAGGLNPFAAENDIRILRRKPDGTQIAIPFEYAQVKEGKALHTNVILRSRDVVVVP